MHWKKFPCNRNNITEKPNWLPVRKFPQTCSLIMAIKTRLQTNHAVYLRMKPLNCKFVNLKIRVFIFWGRFGHVRAGEGWAGREERVEWAGDFFSWPRPHSNTTFKFTMSATRGSVAQTQSTTLTINFVLFQTQVNFSC